MNLKMLREQLAWNLRVGHAHVSFEQAVADFPPRLRGARAKGVPWTAWQILEHIRICQWDILDFSRNPNYKEMRFPDDYWPRTPAPPSRAAWAASVRRFLADRRAMERLVLNPKTDLFARIPHGSGQNVLREILVVADHNAYHIGQLVLLRRMLGAWPRAK
jgi:hypothetical protein